MTRRPLPWPRSLFGRLCLILAGGLLLAYALSFALILYQQAQMSKASMLYGLGKDVATGVAILERLPAAERPAWLNRLERRNYRFVLGPVAQGAPVDVPLAQAALDAVRAALGAGYAPAVTAGPDPGVRRLDLHVRLRDGTPLTVVLTPAPMPLAVGLVPAILIQLGVLAACMWWAVRLATRPLAQLADAADRLAPAAGTPPLPEDGPLEVAKAAQAFNAMQRRIADFLAERMHILAAVSHDLQTPITRMRLRAELLDDAVQRDKMLADLLAMQALVEEGIAYARDASAASGAEREPARRTNLDALLASIVYDYLDAGQNVRLQGELHVSADVRPQALRRILANLIDNALKFGGEAEVEARIKAGDGGRRAVIAVLDRGPGIDPAEWQAVLRPFYRIEHSRNRDTGGTGLGLAIADQLARAMGASLVFALREGGGLIVRLVLPLD